MPVTATPIFAQAPYAKSTSFVSTAACTTRAPTGTANLATANIIELCPTSTNGRRIDKIIVKAAASALTGATVAGLVGVWLWDGTNAFLIDEIEVTAVTPSSTVLSYQGIKSYDYLELPSTFKLFGSTSVGLSAATTALSITLYGADY